MIIDRNIMQEYPFDGVFYTKGIDESKPLDQQVEEDIVILETKCDIQGAQKEDTGVISNAYNVYFPFDKNIGVSIKKGNLFKGLMYGISIKDAVVVDVIPNQLGGCAVYIKDNTTSK